MPPLPPPTPITFLITDLHLGGTPLLLRDLALALRPHNFAPSIISLKPFPPTEASSPPRHSRQSASDVSSFDHSSFEFDSSFVLRHSSFPTIPQQLAAQNIPTHSLNLTSLHHLPRAIPKFINILRQQQPSIIYSMLIHANTLATLALPFLSPRPKLIHSIHTLQPNPRWHWTLQGIIAPFADALIAPAQPILDKIALHGPLPRSIVIPNGSDIDRFANASPFPPDSLPWPANAPVIGYLGRFDPVKNIPLLLHAFARISPPKTSISAEAEVGTTPENVTKPPSPHLALVGYGPQETDLKNLATSLGGGHIAPRVHFLGPTTTPERWLKSFTVFCLPSAVEGFGLTLLEALAAGTPIVALKTPVSQAILRPHDAHLLPLPPSPHSLATVLQQVIEESRNSPLAPTAPQNPVLSYLRSTFSIERMAELHAKFFQNLLAIYR